MTMQALNYMGRVTANTAAKAREILTAAEGVNKGVKIIYGYSATSVPEHSSGRALDFMCTRDQGDWIADYIWNNRKRLRVKWIIWRQRIISQERASEGWRHMADRGSATQNHYDHVHVFFDDGYDVPVGGVTIPGVAGGLALEVGRALVKQGFDRHYRVGPSDSWGPADQSNLREFQMIRMGRYNNLGIPDDDTRRVLREGLFTSSVRHAVEYFTPIDVRLLKFAALKLNFAPMDAQRSQEWWNSNLTRSNERSKDVGRWYWESQINFQVSIGDEPDPPLGPKQWKLLGEKSKLFVGVA